MSWQPSRSRLVGAVVAVLAAGALAAPIAQAHPDPLKLERKQAAPAGPVVRIDALGLELQAFQYAGTPALDAAGVRQQLVYAGTGCTPAHYAAVAGQIRGKIALVDEKVGANPADQCPRSLFFQKVQSAQQAGAIGFISIPAEGEEPVTNGTAIVADIPAVEVHRDQMLAVRDAVIAEGAVTAQMLDTRVPLDSQGPTPCVDGMAGQFPCDGIDLLSFTSIDTFGGGEISDIWGWTDTEAGDEYVMFGTTDGVAFVRVTDPTAPEYLGKLPNPGVLHEIWHDIKVYEDHAFIVSESTPHGMTVFDLTRLRALEAPADGEDPAELDADAVYPLNVSAHNIAINEDTGYAYIVGGSAALVVPDQCLSGLHMVDIRDPKNPTFAGCYAQDGGPGTAARVAGLSEGAAYIHDTQCVVYDGPDTRYTGRELCFNAAEDQVTIADVTDKSNPITVGFTNYDGVAYAHQGWLTEDQRYLLTNDELDEMEHNEEREETDEPARTRTVVLDVSDLQNPQMSFVHTHDTESIDHNNYVKGRLLYQSNYTSGLRVFDLKHLGKQRLEPHAFFDTYPYSDGATFDGTWSNYPYFDSGTIAVSGIREGLFLVQLAEEAPGGPPSDRGRGPKG